MVAELIAPTSGASAHEVVVFDQRQPAEQDGDVRYLPGDIQDLGQVYGALAGADAVIHLAGISTHSIAPNEVVFRTNAVGTFNVHEAAWRLGIRRVVTLGSEAVLGWAPGARERDFPPAYLPIDEDHPMRPQDAYGLSKQAAEAVARSYTAKCGMETVILRPPWIVSPEELQSLRQSGGVAPTVFGMYHYVDARDLAVACRRAIELPLSGCHVLFAGSGESIVAEPMSTLLPRLLPAIGDMASELTGAGAPVSSARAHEVLDWTPRHSWRGPAETT